MADPMNLVTRLSARYRGLFHALTVGVRGAVIDEHTRVFLVRHTYVRGWHLPGGGVEVGESAQTSAVYSRKMAEARGVGLPTERVERRLTAILTADVAGYSRLMGSDEEGTLAQLNEHRRVSSLMPRSSETAVPAVRMAMSSSIA